MTTLSDLGGTVAAALLVGGCTVAEAGPGAGALARRLVDAGFAHPVPPPGRPGRAADVTVVVPVRNRARYLARLLAAVDGCCAEVVVVDDGSTDRTAEVAAAAGARVLRNPMPLGPAAARMAGVRAARTPYVVFCDSDVEPAPGWLDRLLPHLADPEVAAVAPRVASAPPPAPGAAAGAPTRRGRPRWLSGLRAASDGLRSRYEVARSPLDLGPRPGPVRAGSRLSYVPAATLLIRRELAVFDSSLRFGEDVDLVWRLTGGGATVRYEPNAVVTHRPRSSWRAFVAQRVGYGSSAAGLAARHPGPLRPVRGAVSVVAVAAACLVRPGQPGSATRVLPAAVAVVAAAGWSVVTARRLEGRLTVAENPRRLALALTLGGRRHVVEASADLARRTWLPLFAVAGRPGRWLLAAAVVVPAARDWWRARPDVGLTPWLVVRFVDDAAYCAGVWWGCLREGVTEPLLPALRRSGVAGRDARIPVDPR